VTDLGQHRFEQRKTTVLSILDHLGDVELVDAGRGRRDRRLRFTVAAPGHGLPDEAAFIYAEWYRRASRGWRLTRYQYDYVDLRRGGRFGYHWHALRRRSPVHHAHCEEHLGAAVSPHYRAYELSLLEAHEEFARLYAAEAQIDCSALRPLA
jgi:hypothetical protein